MNRLSNISNKISDDLGNVDIAVYYQIRDLIPSKIWGYCYHRQIPFPIQDIQYLIYLYEEA